MKLLWLLSLCVEVNSKAFCNYILWPLTLENHNGSTAAHHIVNACKCATCHAIHGGG